jgi:hypothetical protein
MVDWWAETEHAILQCLRETGPLSPADLARRLGLSAGEATAFVCMLSRDGKVDIRLVEASLVQAGTEPAVAAAAAAEVASGCATRAR